MIINSELFSLVTSLFSRISNETAWDKKKQIHLEEIEAAIVVNSISGLFKDINIIYETQNDNCNNLLNRLNLKIKKVLTHLPPYGKYFNYESLELNYRNSTNLNIIGKKFSYLNCTSTDLQPSYKNLLEFAFSGKKLNLGSSIVVLSNADVVYDKSLIKLSKMSKNIVNLLTVHGFPNKDHGSRIAHQILVENINQNTNCNHWGTKSYCSMDNINGPTFGRWPNMLYSYDAFITKLPLNLFSENNSLYLPIDIIEKDNIFNKDLSSISTFERNNNLKKNQTYILDHLSNIYTNMRGAEQAVACTFLRSSSPLTGSIVKVWNACKWVKLWHLHCAPKLHHNIKHEEVCYRKRKNELKFYGCTNFNDCLG